MAHAYIIDEDGPREILCPHCRSDANWRFLDEAKSLVEVSCVECGLFAMPRVEFDQAENDVSEPNENS